MLFSGRKGCMIYTIVLTERRYHFLTFTPYYLFFYYAYWVLKGLSVCYSFWLKSQCLDFAIMLVLPVQMGFKCVGSQRAGGLWGNVGSDCVCACVLVCWQPLCFSLSCIFLHWGESASSESPLLFFNIYLTFCLSSDYWNDCKLVWNNRLLQSFVFEKYDDE